ncbi:uncharacterized protein [Melopsittacus undulatus]|uniref:uncharacterized protein isoform X2 n=1 Tax=Melopsittacus undulatus TaxID=13146 RepID=UPI00146F0EB6|nr:uncharacterized protein LOC115945409 isoform X2 [Melopsittacus undulatus]
MNLLAQVSSLVQTLRARDALLLQPQRWLGSWVSNSRQAVAGAASTAAFFLCEGLLGQHFNVVPNGVAEPQPGDLFLFPLASGGPGWWGAHAGVYCGDGEIIHLEGEPQEVVMLGGGPHKGTWVQHHLHPTGSSGMSPSGIVAKHSKSHLLRTRGPAKVLRRKGGMDVVALQQRIRVAMDQPVEYDAVTCNCIHFALTLLGLGQLAGATVGATTLGTLTPTPAMCHHSPSCLPGIPSTAVMEVVMYSGTCRAGASFLGDQCCSSSFVLPLV